MSRVAENGPLLRGLVQCQGRLERCNGLAPRELRYGKYMSVPPRPFGWSRLADCSSCTHQASAYPGAFNGADKCNGALHANQPESLTRWRPVDQSNTPVR